MLSGGLGWRLGGWRHRQGGEEGVRGGDGVVGGWSWGRGWGRGVGFGVCRSSVGMVRGWGPVKIVGQSLMVIVSALGLILLQLRLMGRGKSQRLPFITTSAHPMFFGGAVWWSW